MPAVLNKSAAAPNAVFASAVLKRSDPAPVAVLKLTVVRLPSENQPPAVFAEPVVRLKSAFCPSAVLNPGYPPSGGGFTARAIGEMAQKPIRSATQSKAVRPGEQ